MKRGVLLINLGTPEAPTPKAVRKYLREFLMDPYVIDRPYAARAALVYGIILPLRPRKSARAYQQIWTDRGSPLLFHSLDLLRGVRERLGDDYVVQLGMRYGKPSLEEALNELLKHPLEELAVLPLYPQYSLAATESSLARLRSLLAKRKVAPPVREIPAFYGSPLYLDAAAQVTHAHLKAQHWDHVLFSFHGLPERQVAHTDLSGKHCFQGTHCCDEILEANAHCYRAQSFATAKELAKRLGIKSDNYSVGFQSRLGATPWIRPYTDLLLIEFPKKGIKKLAVVCPSFVADCLETLEEIELRGKQSFLKNGGEQLGYIPSLNAEPVWVNAVCEMVRA